VSDGMKHWQDIHGNGNLTIIYESVKGWPTDSVWGIGPKKGGDVLFFEASGDDYSATLPKADAIAALQEAIEWIEINC
jgi:hypothetical protein